MRNFSRGGRGGFRNNFNSSKFDRDRRDGRESGFRSRPSFKRSHEDRDFRDSDRDKRFRRGDDGITRNNQDRRDGPFGGGHRSFRDRNDDRPSFRGRNSSFRNQSPRFRNDNRSEVRRSYSPMAPSPPKISRDIAMRGKIGRIRRGIRTSSSSIPRSSESRGGRGRGGAGATGSREYLKRMKEARMKLKKDPTQSEGCEDESEYEDHEEEPHHDEDNEDCLDIGNDEELLEDEGESSTAKVAAREPIKKEEKSPPRAEDEQHVHDDEAVASDQDKSFEVIDQQLENEIRKREKRNRRRKPIQWHCVHCGMETAIIREYLQHLKRESHQRIMRKVSQKAQYTLNNLRKFQRERQFEFETKVEHVEEIPSKYCKSCKLYFRQTKVEHIRTDDHRKILIFLRPLCKICDIRFPTPMKYEEHRCAVSHLKTKARRAEFFKEEEDKEIDMSQMNFGDFKTVDSIGDVDGEEDESDVESQQAAVGQDLVTEKKVLYCDLCEEILTFDISEGDQNFIDEHCRSRRHVRFHRHREDDKTLADAAENEEVDVPSTSKASKDDDGAEESNEMDVEEDD